MGADVSRAFHEAIVVPEHELAVWDDETTVTEASPNAGVPTPTAATELALTATGDQTAARRIRTQSPGLPVRARGGARQIVRAESASDWLGWDPPRAPSSCRFVVHNDSSVTIAAHLDAVTTESEVVLVAAQVNDSGFPLPYRLVVYRSENGGTFSPIVVESQLLAPSPAWNATLVVLPSGRVLLYRVLDGIAPFDDHLRLWYSDDDGASWSFGGDVRNLVSGVTRARTAYSDGQIAMVLGGSSNVVLRCSSDNGHTFESVGNLPGAASAHFDVCSRPGGGFVIAAIGQDDSTGVDVLLLGDGYEDPSLATVVSLGGEFANVANAEDVTIWRDGNDCLHVIARDANVVAAAISYDGGASWTTYDSTSTSICDVLDYGTSAAYPSDFVATPVAGRVALFALHTTTGTTPSGDTLACYLLGGWTTRTTPSRDSTVDDVLAAGWSKIWYPVEVPGTATGWTASTTGAPTVGFDSEAVRVQSSTLNYVRYTSATLNSTHAAMRVALKCTGGATSAAYCAARLALGSCEVVVRFSGSSFAVYDGAGTQIGTNVAVALSSTVYQFWIEVNDTTRDVTVRYRPYTHDAERSWSEFTGTASATSPASRLMEFGNLAAPPGALDSWWNEVLVADGNARPVSGADFVSWPADLRGRLYAGSPYIGDDVRLTARHGPTARGEEWTLATAAHYRLAHVLETPSPRVGWRSTSTAAQTIALQWSGAATPGQQAVLGILLRGSNVPKVTISGHNGTSWVALASNLDLTLGTLSFSRVGAGVKPGSTGSSPWLRHGDVAGGTFCYSTSAARRIARHGEGKFDSAASLQPVLRLIDVDDGADPASGSGATIIPDQVLILLELSSDYKAIRLEIPAVGSTFAPAESYWQIGSLVVGWVYPIGYPTSWGRSLTTEAPVESVTTRDRQVRVVDVAPPVRTLSVSWVDGIDQTPVEDDDATEPDYVALDSTAGASERGTAYAVDGIFREVHGAAGELVFLPRVPVLTGTDVFTRRRDALHCRVGDVLVREAVHGDEHANEVVRVSEVVATEIV